MHRHIPGQLKLSPQSSCPPGPEPTISHEIIELAAAHFHLGKNSQPVEWSTPYSRDETMLRTLRKRLLLKSLLSHCLCESRLGEQIFQIATPLRRKLPAHGSGKPPDPGMINIAALSHRSPLRNKPRKRRSLIWVGDRNISNNIINPLVKQAQLT